MMRVQHEAGKHFNNHFIDVQPSTLYSYTISLVDIIYTEDEFFHPTELEMQGNWCDYEKNEREKMVNCEMGLITLKS